MMKLLTLSALAAAMSLAVAADANAWTRDRAVTGRAGTATLGVTGGCTTGANGGTTCSRQATRTGPYGGSTQHQGSVACDPSTQTCNSSGSTTLRNGQTIYRQGSVQY